jgi:branched-chain amino acid transport system substrate-binding protein
MRSKTICWQLLRYAFFILIFPSFITVNAQTVQKATLVKTVKIGVLIPDKNSLSALNGAQMAIRKANEEGGLNGKQFQLVIRTMEGPWGTGSKQAVNLIFDENVCAIMGSQDGRNAHLIEQVTTKTRIVFLSSWASDPTLAQAFVPWYFSVVPNDLQQADAFIEEIYNKRKISRTAVISDNSYDSKLASDNLVKKIISAGKAAPLQLSYNNDNLNSLIVRIDSAKSEAAIFLGKPGPASELVRMLRLKKVDFPVFGALSLINEDEITDQNLSYLENAEVISSGQGSESNISEFREEYKRLYGKYPGLVAAYSYDGMRIMINAIKSVGTDRVEIQKALTKIKFEGITGTIQFDGKGKRTGTLLFMKIKKGIPVLPDK